VKFILSATGRRIDPANPRPGDISIEDIAIGLARERRFRGNTKRPYNVAQHSWIVESLLTKEMKTLESLQGLSPSAMNLRAKAALLHDASEAYIGDIITPIKELLNDYKELEDRWMQAIAKKFMLPHSLFSGTQLKHKDFMSFKAEVFYLCSDPTDYGFEAGFLEEDVPALESSNYPVLHKIKNPWDESFSSSMFLKRAIELQLHD
jgi:hypothetical protein